MNRKILQKAITELLKENGSKEYVVGILETLIETLPEESVTIPSGGIVTVIPPAVNNNAVVEDEPYIPNPTSRLEEIKRMAGEI